MGRGYARHSRIQHRAGDYGMPLLRRALDAVPLPEDGTPFRVADLGVASGTDSLDPMRAVVAGVRSRIGEDMPVTVVHADIPANDFNAMFATITGSPGSYAHEPQVFAHAEASSFYEPLFPPGGAGRAGLHVGAHRLLLAAARAGGGGRAAGVAAAAWCVGRGRWGGRCRWDRWGRWGGRCGQDWQGRWGGRCGHDRWRPWAGGAPP